MECKECKRLRAKLSPLEDADFTAAYRTVEPIEFLRIYEVNFGGKPAKAVTLPELYFAAFGEPGDKSKWATLGRTLKALGWTATKRSGYLFFVMPVEEFNELYGAE